MYLRLAYLVFMHRLRPRVEPWGETRTPFRVRLRDLDPNRHMNNGTYLTIGDLGRIDLMLRSNMTRQLRTRGWYPVVAAQTVRYWRSLKLGQRFEVVTRVLGTDGRSVFLQQRFVVGEELYAESVVRARFLMRGGDKLGQAELEEITGPAPGGLELPAWVRTWSETAVPGDRVR